MTVADDSLHHRGTSRSDLLGLDHLTRTCAPQCDLVFQVEKYSGWPYGTLAGNLFDFPLLEATHNHGTEVFLVDSHTPSALRSWSRSHVRGDDGATLCDAADPQTHCGGVLSIPGARTVVPSVRDE